MASATACGVDERDAVDRSAARLDRIDLETFLRVIVP
jgi:hypothetical protein